MTIDVGVLGAATTPTTPTTPTTTDDRDHARVPRPADERRAADHDRRAAGPLTVAVLAGGRSSEHEVSLSSGAAVREGLLAGGHEVMWIEIGRDGAWRCDGER